MAVNGNKLQVTELDFLDIKENLKTFLKGQSDFSDYDFEGSGLSTLVDLLAYNTHYLAMNANFAANEMFLDSASLRSSVVSHAKTLGYTPRSARAPVAYLDVTVNNSTLTSATLEKGTRFNTSVDGNTYSFVANQSLTQTPINGILRFSNVPVYEGTLITTRYTVSTSDLSQKFMLTDNRADTTTLQVSVQNSSSDATTTTYTLATDITQVTDESNVYFLQEVEDGKFEVYFGDGVIGRSLSDGNIVILEYIVTNKTESNSASRFSFTGTISGETNITVATVIAASGGADAETIQSIKFNAPLDYASQGRAVTAKDYQTIVPQVYPAAQAVQVWGGEDNDPPEYGKVYISIKPTAGITLTAAQKSTIESSLDGYNIASVRPTVVDPEITSLVLGTTFKYDSKSTTKTASDLETIVRNVVTTYNSSDLSRFDGIFRYSKLSRLIDNADPSILSNITTVRMRKSLTPVLNTVETYTLKFNNAFFYPLAEVLSVARPITHPGGVQVVTSSGFTVNGSTEVFYLEDNGAGYLSRFYLTGGTTKTYVDQTAGTINYTTGKITLDAITITGTANSDGTITFTAKPESNDVVPVRNQLVEIDFVNSTFTASVDTITSGGSNAGTGYTTASSN